MYLRVIPQAESGAFSEGTAKAAAVCSVGQIQFA